MEGGRERGTQEGRETRRRKVGREPDLACPSAAVTNGLESTRQLQPGAVAPSRRGWLLRQQLLRPPTPPGSPPARTNVVPCQHMRAAAPPLPTPGIPCHLALRRSCVGRSRLSIICARLCARPAVRPGAHARRCARRACRLGQSRPVIIYIYIGRDRKTEHQTERQRDR